MQRLLSISNLLSYVSECELFASLQRIGGLILAILVVFLSLLILFKLRAANAKKLLFLLTIVVADIGLSFFGIWEYYEEYNQHLSQRSSDIQEQTDRQEQLKSFIARYGEHYWDDALRKSLVFPYGDLSNELELEVDQNWMLIIARPLGALIPGLAVILLIFQAIRTPWILFRYSRWCPFIKQHTVVLGLGWKSFHLIKSLQKNKERILVIDNDPNNPQRDDILGPRTTFIAADFLQEKIHRHLVRAKKAKRIKDIFLLCSDDELNTRFGKILCETEARIHPPKRNTKNSGNDKRNLGVPVYINIRDYSKLAFLENSTIESGFDFNCLDINQDTARDLLLTGIQEESGKQFGLTHIPIKELNDGTYERLHFAIIGNMNITEALILQLLKQLHLSMLPSGTEESEPQNIPIHLSVFANDLPTQSGRRSSIRNMEAFTERFRIFKHLHGTSLSAEALSKVVDYTYGHWNIQFHELPVNEWDLLAPGSPLIKAIQEKSFLNIFCCTDNGIGSKALATRLDQYFRTEDAKGDYIKEIEEKRMPLANFSYNIRYFFNYPEEDTATKSAARLNSFGHYSTHCDCKQLRNSRLETLAQQIAYHYDNPDKTIKEVNDRRVVALADLQIMWRKKQEWVRFSNREAACHTWLKAETFNCLPAERKSAINTFIDPNVPSDEDQPDWIKNPDLYRMAESEHRRWCAEKLLTGYRPFESFDEHKTAFIYHKWKDHMPSANDEREPWPLKNYQRIHQALIPFEELEKPERLFQKQQTQTDERTKDFSIVKAAIYCLGQPQNTQTASL